MKTVCGICPHRCALEEGQTGFCRARVCREGSVVCGNYGRVTSLALDPIEKKPLNRFYPGSLILSVGSYGCNLRCPFCQNCDISMADATIETVFLSPEDLVRRALAFKDKGNIGIAYTYNEPLIGYEYVMDCARLAHENGLLNVAVTNGYLSEKPLRNLLPHLDAMNIDLKGFTERFYKKLCGGLETVKRTVELASKDCHVEVTTLLVPGENDSKEEMEALSSWLSSLNPELPLHVSRFFPRYKMRDRDATPVKTVYELADVARRHLKYVYTGNC
jgi:pyruvate formate lyase activating enzyme